MNACIDQKKFWWFFESQIRSLGQKLRKNEENGQNTVTYKLSLDALRLRIVSFYYKSKVLKIAFDMGLIVR